jgi:pimeloyl-ACP methyl ester carboxylesterase
MESHFLERPFKPEVKSRAILARNPSGKAILFVHGYGGNAITTWSKFDSLLPDAASCCGHDLIFYGYDGLRSDTIASASIFLEFLESLFSGAAALINSALPPSAQRSSDFQYSEILVVAHSLGAVISRWALMMAFEQGRSWPVKTKLVLFAPAHRGANVVKIALESVSGFKVMQILSGLARFQSPLIDQLAQDSRYLHELQERVNRLVGTSGDHCLLARAVFVAEREHVVVNLPFSRDPYPIPVAGSDHFSVCKPALRSDRSVQKLCEFL